MTKTYTVNRSYHRTREGAAAVLRATTPTLGGALELRELAGHLYPWRVVEVIPYGKAAA